MPRLCGSNAVDICGYQRLDRDQVSHAVNVQTEHIAGVVCAFLAAAVPLTIVRTFEMSGICLVKDSAQLLCTIRPERAKRLLIPLPQILLELETEVDDSDETESPAYLEECTKLLYDL
jgi:hypothetical protein